MYGSRDQTHNHNERRVEKDRIAEIPVIAGQHFITVSQTVQLVAFKKCVVIGQKGEAALLVIIVLPALPRRVPKIILQV